MSEITLLVPDLSPQDKQQVSEFRMKIENKHSERTLPKI